MNNHYSARFSLLFFILFMLYGVIIVNLFVIQIWRHQFFTELGKKQYQAEVTFYPPRALIYDRNGVLLAGNKDSLAAFILPKKMHAPEKVKQFLETYFPEAYTRLLSHENSNFMYVKRRLSPEQIELIEKAAIADIQFLHEPSRFYPITCAKPLVGTTDTDNNGLLGIELAFNSQLTGKPALYLLEKDARSAESYFTRQLMQEAQEGTSIVLTIDSSLQFLVYEVLQKSFDRFNARYGAAIVMNPRTGELLALTNIPEFDPYEYQDDDQSYGPKPIKNKAVSDAYELGSVIKVFSALAALEEKVVSPDELIDCKNCATTFIDGRKVNTVSSSVRGIIPFEEVIAASNNIGIAQVAKRLDKKLYEHYRRLGFGIKTGVELPAEHAGFITPVEKWSKHSIISLSYGYEISATLLQLARAFSIIANDGYDVQPTILYCSLAESPKNKQLYSPDTIAAIRAILEKTTRTGTARKAAIKGYTVMTKTGTANMLINGKYDTKKNIFTCAGIIEKGDYQRVVIVCIHQAQGNNLYASTVAVPLFEQIAEIILIHDKVV